jgi:hypothetical protein
MADAMKHQDQNKDAQSGRPVELDKEQQQQGGKQDKQHDKQDKQGQQQQGGGQQQGGQPMPNREQQR